MSYLINIKRSSVPELGDKNAKLFECSMLLREDELKAIRDALKEKDDDPSGRVLDMLTQALSREGIALK